MQSDPWHFLTIPVWFVSRGLLVSSIKTQTEEAHVVQRALECVLWVFTVACCLPGNLTGTLDLNVSSFDVSSCRARRCGFVPLSSHSYPGTGELLPAYTFHVWTWLETIRVVKLLNSTPALWEHLQPSEQTLAGASFAVLLKSSVYKPSTDAQHATTSPDDSFLQLNPPRWKILSERWTCRPTTVRQNLVCLKRITIWAADISLRLGYHTHHPLPLPSHPLHTHCGLWIRLSLGQCLPQYSRPLAGETYELVGWRGVGVRYSQWDLNTELHLCPGQEEHTSAFFVVCIS